MTTRATAKNNPIRDLAAELAKAALAAGALQRQPEVGKTAGEQGRLDASYITRLVSQLEQRLQALDTPK